MKTGKIASILLFSVIPLLPSCTSQRKIELLEEQHSLLKQKSVLLQKMLFHEILNNYKINPSEKTLEEIINFYNEHSSSELAEDEAILEWKERAPTLLKINRKAEKNQSRLLELISEQENSIIEKINVPYETGGIIIERNDMLYIEFIEDPTDKIIKEHLSEIKKLDFVNFPELINIYSEMLKKNTSEKEKEFHKDIINQMTDFYENHITQEQEIKLLINEGGIEEANEFKKILRKAEKNYVDILSSIIEEVLINSMYSHNLEEIDKDSIVYRFHTHTDGSSPSKIDEERTIFRGHSLVFSLVKDEQNKRVKLYLIKYKNSELLKE